MRARSKLTTADDVTLRVYGRLNTKDGSLAFDGYGRKVWAPEGARASSGVDTRFRAGLGFRFSAGTHQTVREGGES